MTGILVVNEFLHSNKFNEIHTWLLEAAKKHGIDMQLRTNAELLVDIDGINIRSDESSIRNDESTIRSDEGNIRSDEGNIRSDEGNIRSDESNIRGNKINIYCEKSKKAIDADFILFWDKDVKLASYLELLGYPVFNSAKAIEICDDKALTHLRLMEAGLPMPRTILAPKTFENIGYTNDRFLKNVADRIGFPMVVKECFGSFGQQVYLASDFDELLSRVKQIGIKPLLFQSFLKSSFGRDLRLQVVGNQVIAAMYRYSDTGDFRANLSIGGRMRSFTPTKEQCDLALKCCEAIGLDFAGVDLLFGEKDEPIVCEVNSNAHFKNIFDCTGVNAADAILAHILEKL